MPNNNQEPQLGGPGLLSPLINPRPSLILAGWPNITTTEKLTHLLKNVVKEPSINTLEKYCMSTLALPLSRRAPCIGVL